MNPTIEVNDREITAAFGRLLAFGARPPLGEIGNTLVDNTRLRFRESRAPDGSAWAALSPVTISRRRQQSSRPLLDTGVMRNSISSRVEGNSVVVGTNARQARMQHFGARKGAFGRGQYRTRKGSFPIPWGDVPARPILGVSREDRGDILDILATAVSGEKS